MKGFIIFEDFKKNINCKEILDGQYTCVISDYPEGTFKGVINRIKVARCNESDTYDFETGALISLMKMCGREKALKAVEELYFLKEPRGADLDGDVLESKVEYVVKENKRLTEENEKLQHDYDLCKNSENALKCSVDYLNKSIAKLNTAIYSYKNDLYKVSKRCRELEAKEDILNKQEETINKREEEMSVYFGGRGCGKQYKALVELFKKMPKDKVQAAYVAAYKESLIWCTSQPSTRDYLDSLIEGSRAFTRKCVDEWLYGPPTKREEMWAEIFAIHKKDDVIIKVKREDVNTFLHEIENKFPEITWASGVKLFETKYTIGDIYDGLKTRDTVYFRLSKDTKLSYSSDPDVYRYKDLHHIDYLPPMRWDLFKKGRIVVGVRKEQYDEFILNATEHIDSFNMSKPYDNFNYSFFMYDKDANFVEAVARSQFRQLNTVNGHKVYYWEDVR